MAPCAERVMPWDHHPQELCGLKGRWSFTIRQKMHDLMEMELCWQG